MNTLIKSIWNCSFDFIYASECMDLTNITLKQLKINQWDITVDTILLFDAMLMMGGEL